jgi:hypothetical protein
LGLTCGLCIHLKFVLFTRHDSIKKCVRLVNFFASIDVEVWQPNGAKWLDSYCFKPIVMNDYTAWSADIIKNEVNNSPSLPLYHSTNSNI